jgi:hypothetical protein
MTYEEFTTHLAELAHHYFDDYYSVRPLSHAHSLTHSLPHRLLLTTVR